MSFYATSSLDPFEELTPADALLISGVVNELVQNPAGAMDYLLHSKIGKLWTRYDAAMAAAYLHAVLYLASQKHANPQNFLPNPKEIPSKPFLVRKDGAA